MIHIELSATAPGVPRKQALAWWWDFREGTHDHRFLGLAPHRTVRELRDGEVLVQDELRRLGIRVWWERLVAHLDGHAIAFEGENRLARFTGAYRFLADHGGTEVRLEADVHLRPVVALGRPVARPVIDRILAKDLEGHVAHMVEELG